MEKFSGYILLFIACLLSLTMCKPKQNAELMDLETDVMAIHDEVMPKLPEMNNDIKKLTALYREEGLSDSLKTEIRGTIIQLTEADSLMWQWMYDYEPPSEKDSPEEVKNYLEQEKKKVEVVREKILMSMEKSKYILTKTGGNESK
jgi:hypothetical protein